eukprot:scaffold207421_cov19-Tisochrysis_lutea.AAC.1
MLRKVAHAPHPTLPPSCLKHQVQAQDSGMSAAACNEECAMRASGAGERLRLECGSVTRLCNEAGALCACLGFLVRASGVGDELRRECSSALRACD